MNSKSQNEPFIIIGSSRSGTTMLRLMLNDHPRLRVPRETIFIYDLIKQLPLNSPLNENDKRLAFELISNHWKWESWAVAPERLWVTIASLTQPTLCQLIDAVYKNCSNPEKKPRWGEKSHPFSIQMNYLSQVFPNAKFIHLVRDARDVYIAMRDAYLRDPQGRPAGQSIPRGTRDWCNWVNAATELGKKLGPEFYLEVTYEDLVLKTEETLKRICAFIGEEYDSRMLKFYENGAIKEMAVDKPHHEQHHKKTRRPPQASDTYRWRTTEMNLIDVALVEAYAGKTMDRIGQTRHFRGPLRLIPYSLRAFDNLNKKFRRIFIPTNKDRELIYLPDSAYFLYYLLRPIRLLGKYTLIAGKRLLPT